MIKQNNGLTVNNTLYSIILCLCVSLLIYSEVCSEILVYYDMT